MLSCVKEVTFKGGAGGRIKIFYERNISPLSYSTPVRGGAGGGWLWNNLIGEGGEGGTVYVERIAWNQPPVALASASPNPAYVGEAVSFSSAGSYDPDGRIVAYRWEFGDGATSSEANTGHAYMMPGNYTATLTVTDDKASWTSGMLHKTRRKGIP